MVIAEEAVNIASTRLILLKWQISAGQFWRANSGESIQMEFERDESWFDHFHVGSLVVKLVGQDIVAKDEQNSLRICFRFPEQTPI